MRRGLIAWSKAELPQAVLEARVERARAAMAEAGLDALLLYTNNTRTAAVSWRRHRFRHRHSVEEGDRDVRGQLQTH